MEIEDVFTIISWLRLLNKFDVFLYHLPEKIYSSIDGTLGDAMLLKKAVVYFGPEAPKERLINGVNGLIAKTEEEITQAQKNQSEKVSEMLKEISQKLDVGESMIVADRIIPSAGVR